jgi:putative membrane protein
MEYYLYIKAFHIVAFMSWMAMLFYLPRLFVYHVEHGGKKEFTKVAEIQEEKLYRFIGLPAFWATLISGIVMIALNPDLLNPKIHGGWLHVKLFVLLFLIAYSFSLNVYRKQLQNGTCKRSGKFFRAYNEAPTLLSIIIVVCAVTKEFYPLFTVFMVVLFSFTAFMIMRKK